MEPPHPTSSSLKRIGSDTPRRLTDRNGIYGSLAFAQATDSRSALQAHSAPSDACMMASVVACANASEP